MYHGLKQNMDQQHVRLLLCDAARVVKPNGIVLLSVGQLSAGAASVIGPAWTRGEIEKPAGERDMGGWTSTFYTTEQQHRLQVDQYGVPLLDSTIVPLRSFLNSDWLKGAATSCGFEVQSLVPAKSFTGLSHLVLVRFKLIGCICLIFSVIRPLKSHCNLGIYLQRKPTPKPKKPSENSKIVKVVANSAKQFVSDMMRNGRSSIFSILINVLCCFMFDYSVLLLFSCYCYILTQFM